MWKFETQSLGAGRGIRARLRSTGGGEIGFGEVLVLWKQDAAFRSAFVALLRSTPFRGYRWETPALSTTTADRPFECVLLNAPGLVCRHDPSAFDGPIGAAPPGDPVVTFANLGGDATLVVPRPTHPANDYGHLAAFTENAPEAVQHDLWRAVGAAAAARSGDQPIWISTAGMGVPWLHVRLDTRPKYYRCAAYRAVC